MTPDLSVTILRHAVPSGADDLSPLQARILAEPAPVRVFSAPTGAGKSHAFVRAAARGKRVLFIVPTRRLAQNLAQDAANDLAAQEPPILDAVGLWSSDETERQRQQDPAYRSWRTRLRQVTAFEEARFIVATPESVALMLLRYAWGGPGTDPFAITHLTQNFDHIVFDEFHSIDARGFGLCAVLARACSVAEGGCRVTFLSATPIGIVPVLTALGVPEDRIATGSETVLDHPPGSSDAPAPGLRILHGDVRIDFVAEPDMVELLQLHAAEIRACIARGRQLVVIFDSLEELQKRKQDLAALFGRLEIALARRLAINSIDDSASTSSLDGPFTTDRSADPRNFDVLLATSSVEMGVTFRAGMLVMDAGHDELSFVQRVGRVARADEPGLVVVRLDPARWGRQDWLRGMVAELRAAPGGLRFPVSCFLKAVLKAVRARFDAPAATLHADDVPTVFRSMPHRAVWAACLFWHALERGRPRHLVGQGRVLDALAPAKVGKIAALLRTVAGDGTDRAGFGPQWAQAFLKQAETLRDIAATVAVQEPGRHIGAVPLTLIERYPALQAFPLIADEKGGWTLFLDRPIHAVLRESERVFSDPRRVVLLPNGQSRTVAVREAVDDAIRAMRLLKNAPGTTERLAVQLGAAIDLVRLSGLVPGDAEAGTAAGAAVL